MPGLKTTSVAALTAALVATALTLAPAAAEPVTVNPMAGSATAAGLDWGVAVDPTHLTQPRYADTITDHFNLLVAENAMKWDATEPTPGAFTWTGADAVTDFATDHDLRLYGHTLVFHSQLPSWVEQLDNPGDVEQALRRHVTEVAGRYAGRVDAWDVANEVIDDNQPQLLRDSVFSRQLGEQFLDIAFRTARAADPTARLCLNDYGAEGLGPKSDALYALVQRLLDRGVPIDCVGFQSHFQVGGVPATMPDNLARFTALGVTVRLTELDVRIPAPATPELLQQQATDYATATQLCADQPGCDGVTVWGVTDAHSWIPSTFPGEGEALLFDSNYQPKPAAFSVADVLHQLNPVAVIISPRCLAGRAHLAISLDPTGSRPLPVTVTALDQSRAVQLDNRRQIIWLTARTPTITPGSVTVAVVDPARTRPGAAAIEFAGIDCRR